MRSLTFVLVPAVLAAAACAQAVPQYKVDGFGIAGFGTTGIAGGNIVGRGDDGSFLVNGSGVQTISSPGGTGVLGIGGVNRNGMVAGTAGVPRQTPSAFVWKDGVATLLTKDNGNPDEFLVASRALDVNDAGTVVGNAESPWSHQEGGVVWSGDSYRLLTSLDPNDAFADTSARAINNSGIVVGSADVDGGGRAAFWDAAGNGHFIGGLGDRASLAEDVNDFGFTVGYGMNADDTFSAFVNDGTTTTLLANIDGFVSGDAAAINNAGLIVGYSIFDPIQEGVATLWANGKAYDLNTLLGASGADWQLLGATGIDDDGTIVGYGNYKGEYAAFRLTPVPEPATLLALAAGLTTLARRRRK